MLAGVTNLWLKEINVCVISDKEPLETSSK